MTDKGRSEEAHAKEQGEGLGKPTEAPGGKPPEANQDLPEDQPAPNQDLPEEG